MILDTRFTLRRAETNDVPHLERLMNAAIGALLKPHLSQAEIEASYAIMGLDRQLIEDGTYFVVAHADRLVGSGGWSWRATLFGGDHTGGRDARRLDPATEPARIRAMYTDPGYARRGIGRVLLAHCERLAAERGFRRTALAATLAGLPLYRACHYREIEYVHADTPSGVRVPLVNMEKILEPSAG